MCMYVEFLDYYNNVIIIINEVFTSRMNFNGFRVFFENLR